MRPSFLQSRVKSRARSTVAPFLMFRSELDGTPDGFLGFAGQTEDEVAVNDEAEFLAVPGEVPRPFDGRALLNVLEDLLVARLVAHDQQAATGLFHCLQRLVIRGDA